jgi:opacity protein-like surface antigen
MRALVLLGCLLLAIPRAHAVDGISLELGTSDSSNASVDLARIGVQWNWSQRWALGPNWHIGGYWDASFGYWDNDSRQRSKKSIYDLGFTPVFRLQQTNPSGVSPYLEAAIGLHYLSQSSVGAERRFGTRFNFGDHLGVGLQFGPHQAFDLGYRYQHLSNASIKQPNQGINFHQVRLQYHF